MYKNYFLLICFLFFSGVFSQISETTYIEKVIQNKKWNIPNNFQLTAYNKLIVTANPSDLKGYIDTIYKIKKGERIIKSIDSSDFNFKKIISKQHLYQTEKISVLTNNENHTTEDILSTKMAGFQEPIYEYFSIELQPFSLYSDKITFVENEYVNPISLNGIQKYNFTLQESITLQNRAILVIYFEPKKNKEGLQGILYIDPQKWSIAKAVFNISGKVNITATHTFAFNDKLKNWFPEQSTIILKKGNNKYPIKILGETIAFEGSNPKYNPLGKKYASDFLEIRSKTKYSQITFGIQKSTSKKHIAIRVSEKAIQRKEELWYSYFNDSTDIRSKSTYVSLDSLIRSRRIENKIKIGRKIIQGFYPIGPIDLDLRYLARYNNYEGFRIGLGGKTNEKLSKRWKLETYTVYGTKDGNFKGNLSGAFRLHNATETWLGLSYKDDLTEIANTSFEIDKKGFKIYDPRPFNLNTFYNHETWKGYIESKAIPKTESIIQITQSFIEPKFNYEYYHQKKWRTDFYLTAITASIQWNPYSKFMQTPNGLLETEKNFPKFTFQFSKSIPNLWKNSYDFGAVDFRFDYQKKFGSNHKLQFLLETGYVFGDAPITHLYNHSPNNLTRDKIIQRITFSSKDSFETMYFNEFFSNKYLSLHWKHQFPKLEISRQIKPLLVLATRYSIGELDHKDRHRGLDFKTLDKGYLESGLECNKIYKGIGFTTFYRYGPNQLPKLEDNIAIKLSVQINLGFNN